MHASTTEMPNLAAYDVILVNSSGGKDSQAMLDEVCTLAEAVGVLDRITVLHCALGHVEWPGTSELARKRARTAPRPSSSPRSLAFGLGSLLHFGPEARPSKETHYATGRRARRSGPSGTVRTTVDLILV
ncbi:hypothetical protein ACFS2C_18120 [Prauserella oleivorans]|uniref:Uncharacterized protein n=2 Tax=Pseudonocardiaceae TaxID=2070 RepID=A0ABP7JS51_9PSEU|nr:MULTISPECIES: hypothetical protein [Pseudonocardiaceae]MCF6428001.1 hypothetical protein [Amycolatopsis tucumanensis]